MVENHLDGINQAVWTSLNCSSPRVSAKDADYFQVVVDKSQFNLLNIFFKEFQNFYKASQNLKIA